MSGTTGPAGVPRPDDSALRRLLNLLPYLLLAVATLITVVQPGQTGRDQLTTLGLVAVTVAWMLLLYTLRPLPQAGPVWLNVLYTVGQTVLAGVLMQHRGFFFIFAITGFVQAFDLLPPLWGFLNIALTSVLINLVPAGLPTTREWATMTGAIIVVQTTLIGWFGYAGQKFNAQSEQRRQMVAQLEAALAENTGLHAQLLRQAREAGIHDERQRMAHEIHDTIAQGLAGIVTQLQAADRSREDPERWRRHMDQVTALARDSLAAARRSVAAIRPTELDGSHLPDAVASLAARWSRDTGVPVRTETTGEPRPMLAEIEIALFRVTQEALANIAKHARADKAGVTLSYLDDLVMLDVRDDGVGFTVAEVREPGTVADGSGFGLHAIRQRLARVGGSLTVESAPGEGTAINVSIPTTAPEPLP